ncbi:MAG: polymer-forming cytoskeletal protein [Clostridia bacterium]|nr:polymer-forming cytoskeletal protein [Clostridia bacterium]
MFKKKEAGIPESVDTLLGANSIFEGNIQSDGTVRIDGKLKGDLRVNGDVYIGTGAVINGNIFASNVDLAGSIEGNIEAKGLLRILSTARLYGDIQVHSFVADEGGIFQGKCSMLDSAEGTKPAEKSSSKKSHGGSDYKKSAMIDQIEDEK